MMNTKINASGFAGTNRDNRVVQKNDRKIHQNINCREATATRSIASWPVIIGCPPSLKLLIQFSRLFGITYSCIDLIEENKSTESTKRQSNFWQRSMRLKIALKRLLFLLLHITFFTSSTMQIIVALVQSPIVDENTTNRSLSASRVTYRNFSNIIEYELVIGFARFREQFDDFKPILRAVLQNVIHIFIFRGCIISVYNFAFGHAWIRALTRIPNIELYDRDRRFAMRLIGKILAVSCAISFAGISLYQAEYVSLFFAYHFSDTKRELVDDDDDDQEGDQFDTDRYYDIGSNKLLLAKRIMVIGITHLVTYVIELLIPALFVYTVTMFERNMRSLRKSISTTTGPLREIEIEQLRARLSHLADAFERVRAEFAFALALNTLIDIYVMIAAGCFLVIANVRTRIFAGFFMNFCLFCAIRIATIFIAANRVTIEYDRVRIRAAERLATRWTVPSALRFAEIERLRSRFAMRIVWRIFALKQSTILAAFAFVLSYVVVLLQTENFASKL